MFSSRRHLKSKSGMMRLKITCNGQFMGTQIDLPDTEIIYEDPVKEKNPVVYYTVHLETTEICFCLPISTVKRRFSDFIYLVKAIQKNNPLIKLPPLPSRGFLLNRFSAHFIAERQAALEVFLNRLIEAPQVLSDSTLHYILQTSLTPQQIEKAIEQRITVNSVLAQGAVECFGESAHIPISSSTNSFFSEPPNSVADFETSPSSSSGEHSSS